MRHDIMVKTYSKFKGEKMQRKKYDPKFKAKVAFEAAKGLNTINEISAEYSVHPNVITKWKKHLMNGLPDIFSNGNKQLKDEKVKEILLATLYQKIGQLEVELDWLKKKSSIFL
jgi:transposase